jgi:ribosomal protein L29
MAEDDEAMNVQRGISSKSILSIRVVVETVAVAAILWLANSVNEGNLAIARMQVQLTQVQSTLADVPGLTRQIAQVQTAQAEHDRRLSVLETDAVGRNLRATGAMH